MLDVLVDALYDTALLIPFLFLTYLAMEWLEHKASQKAEQAVSKAGAAGPVVGALLGAVPQCGFSAAAATLFSGRAITLGTLIAVFLSTSDEMLPIFIAQQVGLGTILGFLGAKVVIGMVAGFAVDGVLRLLHRPEPQLDIHQLCEDANCYCEEHCEGVDLHEHEHEHHDHDHCEHHHGGGSIVLSAAKHTLQVTLFVFAVSLALNAVLAVMGEDALASLLGGNAWLAVLAAATVGLIPNCAASVAVAQLYVDGVLPLGACMAGLLVAAGVGLLVLLRTNKHRMKENFAIIGLLWVIGVAVGLIITAVM